MDLSDAVYENVSTDNVIISTGKGMFMKPDGLMIYISATDGGNTVYQYPLSTAFDVTSIGASTANLSLTDTGGDNASLFFKNDGTRMVVSSGNDNELHYYTLSTGWDLSTATYTGSGTPMGPGIPGTQLGDIRGIFISDNGWYVYVIDTTDNIIYQYIPDTFWGPSTYSLENSFDLSTEITSPRGVWLSSDGTEIFISDYTTAQGVHSYSMSTAYNVSTMVSQSAKFLSIPTTTLNNISDIQLAGPTTGIENFYAMALSDQNLYWFKIPIIAGHISGVITELTTPVERTVRVYLSSTGELVDSMTSDPTTGAYDFGLENSDKHFVVVFDDVAGTSYNAKILAQMTPS